jgi:hypothetical protein
MRPAVRFTRNASSTASFASSGTRHLQSGDTVDLQPFASSGTRHLQSGDTVDLQPLRWTLLRCGIISKRLLRMTFSVEATSTRQVLSSEPYGEKEAPSLASLTPEAFPKTTFIPEWQRRGCSQWNGIQRRALSRYCPMCRQATTKT